MKLILHLSLHLILIIPLFSKSVNLKVLYKNNTVEVSWINPKHTQIDYFVIEKSRNGKYYSAVTSVKGDGTLGTNHIDYYEIDNKPFKSKGYYRIKSVDINGKVYYSDVAFAQNNEYYQPLSNLFKSKNKDLKGFKSSETLVVLIDEKFEEYIAKVSLVEERNQLIVTESNVFLPTGNYIVSGTSEDFIYGKKITVDGIYARTE